MKQYLELNQLYIHPLQSQLLDYRRIGITPGNDDIDLLGAAEQHTRALAVAKEFNGDVQIELTGFWTWEQAQEWRDVGIQQVVYHRSRDAQAAGVAWSEADIAAIKRLTSMGFKATVTGGLALEDLPLFKGIPIHVFIAGRSIRDAADPVAAAREFKRAITQLWG